MALTWATEQSITQLTGVVNTEQISTALDLTAAYKTAVEILANSDQTPPVDGLIVRVYRSNDDTTYDNVAWLSFSFIPATTGTEQMTFDIPTCRWVKLGVEASGATDTYVVDADYQRLTAV